MGVILFLLLTNIPLLDNEFSHMPLLGYKARGGDLEKE